MNQTIFRIVQGILRIRGATDNTLIGNTSDRLKVDGTVSDTAPATQNITAADSVTATFAGANGQSLYAGTPTANSAATFALSSQRSVNIGLSLIGTGGTVVVEVSSDGGTFWMRPSIFQPGTTNYANSFTAPFVALVNTAGMTHIRARATAWTSGTGTITVKESLNDHVVAVTDSNLPVGAATSANQATEITSLQLLDDVPTAQNGTLVKGTPIMGQMDDTSTVVATENNVSAVRINAQRAIHVNLRSDSGTETATASNPVRVDPTGTTSQPVVGNVAHAATDSGNPVKTGAKFNSTPITVTDGQRADSQSNRNGFEAIQFRNNFSNLTGNGTTTVKSGAGVLHGISINNNGTNGVITLYDNTAGSGTKIMTIAVGTPSGGLLSSSGQPTPIFLGPFGAEFSTGLTVVRSGSTSNDITLFYL